MNNSPGLTRRILSRAVVLVVIFSLIIPPDPVQAWKSNAHVYLAELARLDALDGSITLTRYDPVTGLHTGTLGPYPVDPKVRLALQRCPAQYRAGALGPDAYPDVFTGQLLTHPNNLEDGPAFMKATNTSQWINSLWAAVPMQAIPSNSTNCTAELAQLAFATGYLTHTAGDMYGHTFINNFAGGSFDLVDNALQHIIIEGYVDKLIPDTETPNFYNISIENVVPLIYDVLVRNRPGYTTYENLYQDKANILSLPRFFNSVRRFPDAVINTIDTQIANYDERIAYYTNAAANCGWSDTSCSAILLGIQAASYLSQKEAYQVATVIPYTFFAAWLADIDDGLHEWVLFNHEVALTKIFKPDAGRPEDLLFAEKLADFICYSLLPMSPLPDAVGVAVRLLIPVGYPDFVNKMLMWGDNFFDYLMDYDLYGGITMRKLMAFPLSPASLFDVVVMVGNGPKIYRQQFRREVLHLPPQTGVDAVDAIRHDATIQSLIQQAQQATGIQRVQLIVTALDRAASLEKSLTPEVLDRLYLETLDYELIPAMRNTLAMDKLILISRTGMDQLLNDINYRCESNLVPTPIMLGSFMRSLDDSDQGLDPQVKANVALSGSGSQTTDNRLLMGIARDPVAYRTIFSLQEGHSDEVLGYLSQSGTQCPADADYRPCTNNGISLVASFDLPEGSKVIDMTFSGDLLYLTAGTGGLYILHTPSLLSGAPAERAHLQLREGFHAQNILLVEDIPWYGYGQVDVAIPGVTDVAYISDGQTGLIAVNVSDPLHPEVLADFSRMQPGVFSSYATDTYGIAMRQFNFGDFSTTRLFISAGYNGTLDLEVSTPDIQEYSSLIPQKRLIQNPLESQFNVLDVDLLDQNTLVLTTNRYLMVFDVSPTALSPILLAYTALPETAFRTDLISSQGIKRAYVADGRGGLQVYNLSAARSGGGITHEGGLRLTGISTDVAVVNDSKAVVAATNVLHIVDTSSFNTMQSACPLFMNTTRVRLYANRLYIGQEYGLKIYTLP